MDDESKKGSDDVIKAGGWKTRSSKVVYENPWIKVSHEEVTTPANTPGIYGVVHFKGQAVGIIPIDEEGNTWLVRQSRYTLDAFTWEIPEGGAAEGESLLGCAQRELAEEVGLRAQHWRRLQSLHISNSVTDECGTVFVATELSTCEQALEDSEDITVKKLSLEEALRMVFSGEITDAMSVAGLLRLAVERGLNASFSEK